MAWKWVRNTIHGFHEWWLCAEKSNGDEVDPPYARVNLRHEDGITIYRDPRTGKPWTSMQKAKEWFDEVRGEMLRCKCDVEKFFKANDAEKK
jgi:hypothetical protein